MVARKPEVPVSMESNKISTKFQRLPPHLSRCPTHRSHLWHCAMPSDYLNSKWRTANRKYPYLWYGKRCQRNSNGHPTYAAMPYPPVTPPTLPDVGRLPKFKMADCRPELKVFVLWNEISTRFQRLAHILAHGQLTGDTADIVRCQRSERTTEIQKWWHANRKYPYLWNRIRYQRNSNGYPHI
jgi:hypothetical protein